MCSRGSGWSNLQMMMVAVIFPKIGILCSWCLGIFIINSPPLLVGVEHAWKGPLAFPP